MPAETAYKSLIFAICLECTPIQVIDNQGNCGCNPKPALRKATLCPHQDWENSCPNPCDPGELSARHSVQFEKEIPGMESLPGPITWKSGQFLEQSSAWRGGQCSAKTEKQLARSPFLEQQQGSKYQVELNPPPKILTGLTEKEAQATAESCAWLMDDIFANR